MPGNGRLVARGTEEGSECYVWVRTFEVNEEGHWSLDVSEVE